MLSCRKKNKYLAFWTVDKSGNFLKVFQELWLFWTEVVVELQGGVTRVSGSIPVRLSFAKKCWPKNLFQCQTLTLIWNYWQDQMYLLKKLSSTFLFEKTRHFKKPEFASTWKFSVLKTALVSIIFILELSVLDKSCLELNFQAKGSIFRVPCTPVFLRSRTSGFQYWIF